MNRKLLQVLLGGMLFLSQTGFAAILQQIQVSNMLWNVNGAGGSAGLTQTPIIVAFKNGGATPCVTSTLQFQGVVTVGSGTGQTCVAKITSVSITPVAVASGTTYAKPADIVIDGTKFVTQILVEQASGGDPVFESTNGAIKTQGVVNAVMQTAVVGG